MANKVTLDIELVTKAFEQALKGASNSASTFEKQMKSTSKGVNSDFDKVGTSAKKTGNEVKKGADTGVSAWEVFKGSIAANVVTGAFGAITGAASSLFNLIAGDGVAAAQQQQDAINGLTQALKSNNNFTDAALASLVAFGDEIQNNSKIGNETALELLGLAASLGLNEEQAKAATQAAIDYSVATGQDARSAVLDLSKTFNGARGPMNETVQGFKDLTEAELKAGKGVELLSAQYGGAAKASLESYSGQVAQAKNNFGDFLKEVARLVTENPAVVATVKEASSTFFELGQYIVANSGYFKELVANALGSTIEGFQSVVSTVKSAADFFAENSTTIKALGVGLATAAVALGAYNLVVNASVLATKAATIATTAFNVAMRLSPVGIVLTAITALGAGIYLLAQNWDFVVVKMKNFAGAALSVIAPAINTILDTIRPLVSVFSDDLAASIDAAKEKLAVTTEELLAAKVETDEKLVQTEVAKSEKLNALDEKNKAAELQREQKAANSRIKTQIAEAQEKAKAKREAEEEALKAEEEAAKKRIEQATKEAEERKALEEAQTNSLFQELTKRKTFEESTSAERAQNFRSSLGQISQLQGSANKQLFETGKAAAIAQATISTYQAATVALASAPPPFNFALAAAVTTAGLLNVNRIANQSPPSAGRFQDGGIVGGSSFTGDRLTASVNSSEMILNRAQQQKLFNLANGNQQSNNGSVISEIRSLASAIFNQPIFVQIDGETIAKAVRDERAAGYV
jgi:hypothetical protein